MGKVQKHLRDCLFHGLHKELCNSMHYLYDDLRVMYPKLMTVAHKVESEQEDRPGEGVQVKSAHSEGRDGIRSLKEQIAQFQMVTQIPPQQIESNNSWPLGNGRNGNINQSNKRGNGNSENSCKHTNTVG